MKRPQQGRKRVIAVGGEPLELEYAGPNLSKKPGAVQKDEFPRSHTEVMAISRRILKREWERVKQPRGPKV